MAKADKEKLGKGIRALLGQQKDEVPSKSEETESTSPGGIQWVEIDAIEINPFQPRNNFNDEAIEELSVSIQTFGLIQPITVRRLDAEKYQLISGERRLRASRLANLNRVPAYVRKANDQQMLEMALVENIQRADLNAIEVAISYQRLISECNLTHEALSNRIGKNRSTVTNYIRLLKLPPPVQKALKLDKISMGHARSLLGLETQDTQLIALDEILHRELSVRDTEKLVRKLSGEPQKEPQGHKTRLSPPYQQLVDHLSRTLGTKVHMKRSQSGSGSITIKFSSDEELNRILDNIDGN